MRLLQRLHDNAFKLTSFNNEYLPPYAILSHTWTEGQEVTYNEVVAGEGKNKTGYDKLQFCAEQAATDGYQYFWIDTCCINKVDPVELSTAINSMYRWYQRAAKCYVYLSDICVPVEVIDAQAFPITWYEAFRQSRWFTRGWTLQELLAPPHVEFFSKEGRLLGSRISLEQEIYQVTTVPIKVLRGQSVAEYSIKERMRWAATRATTLKEDKVYCLLGIFGVFLPLIYGEGEEYATQRLQEEIARRQKGQGTRDQHSLSVSQLSPFPRNDAARDINHTGHDIHKVTILPGNRPKPAPSSTVPFRRDDDFVACDSLDNIQHICAQPAGRAALIGLGGVGKSQIAIEYTHQVRDASPATWAFWVHAGSQARFEEGYRRIAEAAKIDGRDDPKADVLRLVRSWLCDESNGRWTMVVDNADDANVFISPPLSAHAGGAADPSQATELLSDFLPQSPNGSVLVTSRSRDVAYRLTGSHASIFEVRPMEAGDALALLQKKLRLSADVDIDVEKAKQLVQDLDRMPLAITQAAAFIVQRAPRMTIARYLEELHKSDRGRAKLLKQDVGDSRRDGRASNSIIATWQISFEHIRRAAPAAARLLSLMSLFDRQGIPESLLRDQYVGDQDTEDADFDDDIYVLTSYSLVEMSSADGTEFAMHRLVQYSTTKWLELCSELEEWKARYAIVIDNSYPVPRYENWNELQALFPHAQAALKCRPEEGARKALEAWASVLSKAAWYVNEIGYYQVAYEMVRNDLEVSEKMLGHEHPHTLASMSNLAGVLDSQGKYEEAEAMNRQTLARREKVLGPEHPSTLTSMNNLALVLNRQGKYEEAEAMNRQTLARTEKVLGPEHPSTLTSMSNLAGVLNRQGKYEEAEAMNRQELECTRKLFGLEHPHTLTSMSNLAQVLDRQGKYEEAEAMNRQTLARREKVLGPEHPSTLTSMNNLALVLDSQGKYEEAEAMNRQTLARREKVLGPEHPSTLTSMSNLAGVLNRQGKYEEAEAMNRQELECTRKVLGPEHPDTLTSMSNLAGVLDSQGKYEEAEAMNRQTLARTEKVLGPEHPSTLASMSNLAFVLNRQGKYEEAEAMNRQTLAWREKVLGPEHPDTLTSVFCLAHLLSTMHCYKESLALYKRACARYEAVLGKDHPTTRACYEHYKNALIAEQEGQSALQLAR